MKIKFGPFYSGSNKQKLRINKELARVDMHSTEGEEFFYYAVHIKLYVTVNCKDLNQRNTDSICNFLMKSININTKDISEIAEKQGISLKDPCCFRMAICIRINGKHLFSLTNYKIEEVEAEKFSPSMKKRLWQTSLDADYVKNPERAPARVTRAKFFDDNIRLGEEIEEKDTKVFVYMDPEESQCYQDEIRTFRLTLETLKAQIKDEVQAMLKPKLEINCGKCMVM